MHNDSSLKASIIGTDAGIAIGPIMFVIAILGVLAAAIAAGSGSFTAGSTTETNRVKASTLIEIGENLKIGFDRITLSGYVDYNNVYISPSNTSASTDLFAPSGGGINPPSLSMANAPATDVWYYPLGNFNGLGASTYPERLAVLKVSSGVCDEVNNKANGLSSTPTAADVGNFQAATLPDAQIKTAWPANLKGKEQGCVNNSNTATTGYYFYKVLGVR